MTDAPTDLPAADPAPTGATAIAGDATEPTPGAAPAGRPGPTRLQRTTAIIATLGVAVAVLGLLALLRPISTPAVECGSSLTVLLDGRPDQFIDPSDPPAGVTAEEAEAHNAEMCRARVADAARPAVIAIAVGILVAIGAVVVEAVERALAWRQRVRARRTPVAPEPDTAAAGPPGPTA